MGHPVIALYRPRPGELGRLADRKEAKEPSPHFEPVTL